MVCALATSSSPRGDATIKAARVFYAFWNTGHEADLTRAIAPPFTHHHDDTGAPCLRRARRQRACPAPSLAVRPQPFSRFAPRKNTARYATATHEPLCISARP